jgi:hypothetical protein
VSVLCGSYPHQVNGWVKGAVARGCKQKRKPPVGARRLFQDSYVWSYALFELLGNVIELGIKRAADRIDGGNDHNRDAGGDQAVFDSGSTRLIIQKGNDLTHLTQLLWVDTAKPYRLPLKEDFAKRLNIAAELFQMLPTIGQSVSATFPVR